MEKLLRPSEERVTVTLGLDSEVVWGALSQERMRTVVRGFRATL